MSELVEYFSQTPALCEAVIAGYACERLPAGGKSGTAEQLEDKHYLLSHAGELALHGLSLAQRSIGTSEPLQHVIAASGRYEDYLARIGERGRQQLIGRAALLGNFASYEKTVRQLVTETADMEDRTRHPAFLAYGGGFEAYKITGGNGSMVIRLPRHREAEHTAHNIEMTYERLAAGTAMRGYSAFEQFAAGSLRYAATVSHYIPGQELSKLTGEDITHLPEQSLADWIDATLDAFDQKVLIDEEPQNVLLTPDKRIVFVDYELAGYGLEAPYRYRTTAVKEISRTIQYLAESGQYRFLTTQEFTGRRPFIESCWQLIERFLPVAAKKLKRYEFTTIEKHSRRIQNELFDLADRYADPVWSASMARLNRFISNQ
jgi:hypothetical protein